MRARTLLPCLAMSLLLAAPPRPAHADAWSDAKREFRSAQRSEDWKVRRSAYQALVDHDGADCVREILGSAVKEENAAVVLGAIRTLGSLETEAAHAEILKLLESAKGDKATWLLMALAQQKGPGSVDALRARLAGKDPQQAALAALALGAKAPEAALADLLAALAHEEWRVVSAAARALGEIAWSARTKPSKPSEGPKPAPPAWFDREKVLWGLIDRLEKAEGPERADLIDALETITKKDYGWNVGAWAALNRGKEPGDALLAERKHPPYMFGIPIYGRRVVVVLDANVLTDNSHPFRDHVRLKELCKVPGARDLNWMRIKTIKEFNASHVRRGISDMESRDHKFDLVFSGIKPKQAFGKLNAANGGNKKSAIDDIDKLKLSNGNDILTAMNMALDVSGKKDTVAWQKGPDLVVCVYSSVPWQAEETDGVVVGSAVGLKAAKRQVKIHAVGVHEHAYEMMKLFAGLSGGRYLKLTE